MATSSSDGWTIAAAAGEPHPPMRTRNVYPLPFSAGRCSFCDAHVEVGEERNCPWIAANESCDLAKEIAR